jgi:hypothetical protein
LIVTIPNQRRSQAKPLVGRDALKKGVDTADDIVIGKVASARESSFAEGFEVRVSINKL